MTVFVATPLSLAGRGIVIQVVGVLVGIVVGFMGGKVNGWQGLWVIRFMGGRVGSK